MDQREDQWTNKSTCSKVHGTKILLNLVAVFSGVCELISKIVSYRGKDVESRESSSEATES